MARSPLAGKRVLVTRAKGQAEKTAARVRERGAEPVLLPTIALTAPEDERAVTQALDRAGDYAWVVFTSANGVEWAWRAMTAHPSGIGALQHAKIAVVGQATAEAVAERGRRADVVAVDSKGEGLAEALLDAVKPGERVLLLRALVARDVLPDTLRAAGTEVDVVAVYATRPPPEADVASVVRELEGGAIDAVTFTSGSTVDNFVALVGGAGGRGRSFSGRSCAASAPLRARRCSSTVCSSASRRARPRSPLFWTLSKRTSAEPSKLD